ncbi:protein NDUFAF4 homolog isoform X2 [Diorhabda sublineata]|uniref:protein NDUFAF4 homolog isoform X2 n=1 Tax=Diorhabda sublineata TaxID=1163346 RepID=UPI0024E13C5D|nr:protein NDUFAF4 homolog isoform X2 [Diorhabda sublineata]
MGKVFSSIKNPFKNFNLESRAHKVISQPKPIPAPRHKRDQETYEQMIQEYPKAFEESLKKNEKLDKHLKNVFVVSQDPNVNIKQEPNPNRPLPADRSPVPSFIYGIKEPDPEKIPTGKTTLGNVLEFISRHQEDPINYNAQKIAEQYVLDEATVGNILKYFRVFEMYLPQETRSAKAKFAGPSLPRIHVIKNIRKQLPPPDLSKNQND